LSARNAGLPVLYLSHLRLLALQGILAIVLAAAAWAIAGVSGPPAEAHHFMCDFRIERRAQTVSIDPELASAGITRDDVLAAFEPWNRLSLEYHGFPLFQEYFGDWWQADILITSQGASRTWVETACNRSFVQRGANVAVVHVGAADGWRNRDMLPHELGHALGLADHGDHVHATDGHIGLAACDLSYVGVMSYCTGRQSWFLNQDVPSLVLDYQVVLNYWSPITLP
jgi:hypothetical protein